MNDDDKLLERFLLQVASMREAQKNYFAFAAKAKKTKLPGDFAAAATALKHSKNLEVLVDLFLAEHLKPF